MTKPLFVALAVMASIFGTSPGFAQSSPSSPSETDVTPNTVQTAYQGGSSSRVPFEWVNGEIIVTATINGIPDLKLIVDTGMSVSALQDVSASGIHLEKSSAAYPIRGMGKDLLWGNRSENLNIVMSGMQISQASLLIVPGSSFVAPMGIQVNGYLGYDILKNYVIKIDYINDTITFMDPQSFNSSTAGISVPATVVHDRFYVTATVWNNSGASEPTSFLLDTGCSIGMVLFRQFIRANPSLTFSSGVERQIEGIGGPLIVQAVPCDQLRMGNIVLRDPYVHLMERDPNGSTLTGVIGNQIWKHFDVTIDFPDKKLFLRENTLQDGTVQYLQPQSN